MSSVENLISQLNTSKVLAEIHLFLKYYPTSSWTAKVSDLPLRTIKTLLYHLARTRQQNIINDLESIENVEESEIKAYVVKLFKSGFQLKNTSTQNNNNKSGNSDSLMRVSLSNDNLQSISSPEKVKQIGLQVEAILKKVSSTDNSKQVRMGFVRGFNFIVAVFKKKKGFRRII